MATIGTEHPGAPRGFTMIELIVVIAVLAILASVALPLATVMEDRARENATGDEMERLQGALLSWYGDFGSFPASLDSLAVNGYLTSDLDPSGHAQDAWFNPYGYTTAGKTATIVSVGVDQTGSTADDLALIVVADARAREDTRDEIATIHVALRNYETLRIPNSLPSLPAHWDYVGATPGAFQALVGEGLLPNEPRFLLDAWDSSYAYPGTPADYVTSPNLGGGP